MLGLFDGGVFGAGKDIANFIDYLGRFYKVVLQQTGHDLGGQIGIQGVYGSCGCRRNQLNNVLVSVL